MAPLDRAQLEFARKGMVSRIATLSASGRPSITPLYFTVVDGHLWLGTADWTLAARDAAADPRVVILLQHEKTPSDRRVLRVTGRAVLHTDRDAIWIYNLRVWLKYSVSPGGLLNNLVNLRLARLMRQYHQQSADKGSACVIDITPGHAEFVEA